MANPGVSAPPNPSSSGGVGTVPFILGTHEYAEKMFTDTWQTTANAQEFVHSVTPGGFLRGVRLLFTSTGGVGGTPAADAPWSAISSMSIENIDGSPILYPMPGYTYYIATKYFRPWFGDPAKFYDYSAVQATPSFSLPFYTEIRNTAGVLANTDARAQYRVRYTFAPTIALGTGYSTAPTFTGIGFLETYSQVDPTDLAGNQVQPVPDGLNLARIIRRQTFPLNNANSNNVIQIANTGNEIRGLALITRNSSNARVDALSDPIRVRLDDRSLGVLSPDEIWHRMAEFYPFLQNGTSTRDTGVYVYPRFRNPGDEMGVYWLPTSNATYLVLESTSAAAFAGPGTIEIVTDEVVPLDSIPGYLEGC